MASDGLRQFLVIFSFERFVKAINKIEVTKTIPNTTSVTISSEESIFVKSNKKLIQVKLSAILFVEAVGNYCKIVAVDEEIQVREKISDLITPLLNN